MNGAAVIAEILKREGTEFLSCYPRNQIIEPCAALDIRPILCRQERVGVREGRFAVQAGPDLVPLQAQRALQDLDDLLVVFDDQDAGGAFAHG